MNDHDRIIEFLVRHPDFFINRNSLVYALTEELIEKYKDHRDWRELTFNHNMWVEVFDTYLDDATVDCIMSRIVKNKAGSIIVSGKKN